MGVRHMTIREALKHVADNPVPKTDEMVALPVYELVCRSLFEVANNVRTDQRSSMARANTARKMIFERLDGRRRAGSHPATRKQRTEIVFNDLTGELE